MHEAITDHQQYIPPEIHSIDYLACHAFERTKIAPHHRRALIYIGLAHHK